MTRRDALTKLVKGMFTLLILAFLYVLFRSLSGPSILEESNTVFDDVQDGQTVLRRVNGTRVWATRLSASQRSEFAELSSFVYDPDSGCEVSTIICAVLAKTPRDGVEIVFTEPEPAQLVSGTPWFGGFVDPSTGVVYDRLGRAYVIKSHAATGSDSFQQQVNPSLTVILVD